MIDVGIVSILTIQEFSSSRRQPSLMHAHPLTCGASSSLKSSISFNLMSKALDSLLSHLSKVIQVRTSERSVRSVESVFTLARLMRDPNLRSLMLGSKSFDEINSGEYSFSELSQLTITNPVRLERISKDDGAGVGGSYYVRSNENGEIVAVFKPQDEEVITRTGERIPIGSQSPIKNGVVVGDGVAKEALAYMLDHGGFAKVPETLAVNLIVVEDVPGSDNSRSLYVTRYGSLQRFVANCSSAENMGSTSFSVDDVHRIALLDLRLCNLDRHEGNILHAGTELVPIDHGLCLPTWKDLSEVVVCWSSWRQALIPFSKVTRDYVEALDPFDDVTLLQCLGVRDDCIMTYVLCTKLVQYCVRAGLCLSDIAQLVQRSALDDEPSTLEKLVNKSSKAVDFDRADFKGRPNQISKFVGRFTMELELHLCSHRVQRKI